MMNHVANPPKLASLIFRVLMMWKISNLFADRSHTIARIRMIRQELHHRSLAAALGFQFFEEVGEFQRIVSRIGHDLCAIVIRFRLVRSRKFQQYGIRSDADTDLRQLAEETVANQCTS